MSLGLKIRDFRQTAGMSQPQLAEAIGIEQSYLSKLENDKSLPSADVLSRLLNAMGIDLETLLSDPTLGPDRQRLAQLPEVSEQLKKQHSRRMSERKLILLGSSLAIALSITLFYTGEAKILAKENHWAYASKGVELENEPNNIFDEHVIMSIAKVTAPQPPNSAGADWMTAFDAKYAEMLSRSHLETRVLPEYRGNTFTEAVPGGKRTFNFTEPRSVPSPINAWLRILGVFGLSLGLLGYFIEWRLGRMVRR